MARPKLVTEVRTDELGEYTVYMNRVCTGPACGVVLTSRNQHRSTLMCKVHGRQKEQQQQHMHLLIMQVHLKSCVHTQTT